LQGDLADMGLGLQDQIVGCFHGVAFRFKQWVSGGQLSVQAL